MKEAERKMGNRANPKSKWSIYNVKKCSICSKILFRGNFSYRCSSHRILSDEQKNKRLESVRKVMTGDTNPMKRLEVRQKFQGANNHLWKGGISPYTKIIKGSFEYKEWRRKVFERDDYTCQDCKKRGIYLEPHHIKGFTKFPESRFDVSNGLTLCRECHAKTDNYKGKAKKL